MGYQISDRKGQIISFWSEKKVILNSSSSSSSSSPSSSTSFEEISPKIEAADLAKELKIQMLNLKSEFMTEDGSKVDYNKMKSSEMFLNYVENTTKLPYVKLENLTLNEKKAFFLNIYNSLVLHAIATGLFKVDWKGMTLCRLILYATASYNIGGEIYSLNDIENGILRNNRVSAVPYTNKPFNNDDQRLRHCIKCDPRIHFALNCGAKSCPPIAFYDADADKIEKQLNRATRSFIINDGVKLRNEVNEVREEERGTLILSKIFDWYRQDFVIENDYGSNSSDNSNFNLVRWIRSQCDDNSNIAEQLDKMDLSKTKVTFAEYDFQLND